MKYNLSILLFIPLIWSCNSNSNKVKELKDDSMMIDYESSYSIEDEEFGTITQVVISNGVRTMTTNSIPNHATGQFPNPANPNTISAQEISYEIPLEGTLTGSSKWARQPGVAVNGVKFEPETNERFNCETGEIYRVEAFQDLLAFGLDQNNAHVQPTGAYHYHGAPTELIQQLDTGKDLILVGFALDGFPMYYSKSAAYKPSFQVKQSERTGEDCNYNRPGVSISEDYNGTTPDGTFVSDWEYVAGLGDLDECNGIEIDGQYVYMITDEYPRISRCLKGEFRQSRPGGGQGGPGGGRGNRPPGGDGPPPRGDRPN